MKYLILSISQLDPLLFCSDYKCYLYTMFPEILYIFSNEDVDFGLSKERGPGVALLPVNFDITELSANLAASITCEVDKVTVFSA